MANSINSATSTVRHEQESRSALAALSKIMYKSRVQVFIDGDRAREEKFQLGDTTTELEEQLTRLATLQ